MQSHIYTNVDMDTHIDMIQANGADIAVYTNRSPGKDYANEDSAGVFCFDNSAVALVVADGMGGLAGAPDASRIIIETMKNSLHETVDVESGMRESILSGVDSANEGILQLGVGAGSTFVAGEIIDKQLRTYHVGDSMALVVGQKGKIKLLTVAHSPVGYALEAGLIDEEEALHHDERHVVSNYLGDPDMRVEIGSPVYLARYDTVLIASDGIYDNFTMAEIIEFIRKGSIKKVAKSLMQSCLARMKSPEAGQPSKPDDMTFILYRRNQ